MDLFIFVLLVSAFGECESGNTALLIKEELRREGIMNDLKAHERRPKPDRMFFPQAVYY